MIDPDECMGPWGGILPHELMAGARIHVQGDPLDETHRVCWADHACSEVAYVVRRDSTYPVEFPYFEEVRLDFRTGPLDHATRLLWHRATGKPQPLMAPRWFRSGAQVGAPDLWVLDARERSDGGWPPGGNWIAVVGTTTLQQKFNQNLLLVTNIHLVSDARLALWRTMKRFGGYDAPEGP